MNQGDVLKKLIKKSKFTQRKIAEELGIKENYLSMLLKNAKLPDDIIERTCEILNINSNDYFSLDIPQVNNIQQRYERLQERYDKLTEKHFTEKTKLFNQIEELRQENHALKNEIIELKK